MVHKLHEERLRKAGWTKGEISHARKVFTQAHKQHGDKQWVFWLLLVVSIIGVFAFAIWIMPVLFFMPTALLAFVLLIIGLCLGTLFTVAVQDIHWIHHGHHGLAAVLISLMSIVAFAVVTIFAETYRVNFPMIFTYPHNPWFVGIFFAIGFLAPYLFYLLTEYRQRT